MVYVYLIAILVLLACYLLSKRKLKILPCGIPISLIALWTIIDNLMLGNFFGANRWTSLTHGGLTVWWILAMIFGYYYPQSNSGKERQLNFMITLMLVYYCYQFVDVAIVSNSTHDYTTVLNIVYRVIVFVPFVYLTQTGKIRTIMILIISALTLVSFKRGAIIVMPIMLFTGYFINNRVEGERIKNPIKKLMMGVAVICLIAIALVVLDKYTEGFLSYRFSRDQLVYGSSRSDKYASAISEISNRSFVPLMLGIGSGVRSGVHNEVLEFAYTFGLIGLLLYIALFICMLNRTRQLIIRKSKYAAPYAMIFVYIFVVGLFSGVYFTHSTFYLMLTLGMVENKVEEELKTIESGNYHAPGQ